MTAKQEYLGDIRCEGTLMIAKYKIFVITEIPELPFFWKFYKSKFVEIPNFWNNSYSGNPAIVEIQNSRNATLLPLLLTNLSRAKGLMTF